MEAGTAYGSSGHRGDGMRLPAATVQQVPVGEPWEGARTIRRYEPDPYAPDLYAVPTLRVSLLQSRLRELDLRAAVVGIYGDGCGAHVARGREPLERTMKTVEI
jgi:hypothetical protein